MEKEIEKDLPLNPAESRKYIKEILDRHQSISAAEKVRPDPTKTSAIYRHRDVIKRIFGEAVGSVEEILQLLEQEAAKSDSADKDWAAQTLTTLRKMSPSSLKVTFAQLRRGRRLDLPECLRMEFRLMLRCLEASDFKEGIRAVLVDKDNAPKWQPATVEGMTEDAVKAYFDNLGDRELILG